MRWNQFENQSIVGNVMALATHCGFNVLTYVRKFERHLYTKQKRFDGADTTEQIVQFDSSYLAVVDVGRYFILFRTWMHFFFGA